MTDPTRVVEVLLFGVTVVLCIGLLALFVLQRSRIKDLRANYKKVSGLPTILPCKNGQVFAPETNEWQDGGTALLFTGRITASGAYCERTGVTFRIPAKVQELRLFLLKEGYALVDTSAGEGRMADRYMPVLPILDPD